MAVVGPRVAEFTLGRHARAAFVMLRIVWALRDAAGLILVVMLGLLLTPLDLTHVAVQHWVNVTVMVMAVIFLPTVAALSGGVLWLRLTLAGDIAAGFESGNLPSPWQWAVATQATHIENPYVRLQLGKVAMIPWLGALGAVGAGVWLHSWPLMKGGLIVGGVLLVVWLSVRGVGTVITRRLEQATGQLLMQDWQGRVREVTLAQNEAMQSADGQLPLVRRTHDPLGPRPAAVATWIGVTGFGAGVLFRIVGLDVLTWISMLMVFGAAAYVLVVHLQRSLRRRALMRTLAISPKATIKELAAVAADPVLRSQPETLPAAVAVAWLIACWIGTALAVTMGSPLSPFLTTLAHWWPVIPLVLVAMVTHQWWQVGRLHAQLDEIWARHPFAAGGDTA